MNRLRLGSIVLAVGFILTLYFAGVFDLVRDPETLRDRLVDMGPWGYVAFVLAFAILTPAGVPGIGMVFVATYVWPKPIAYGLSLTGAFLAALIGFLFARFVARDWFASRIPERFKKYDAQIEERGVWMAFLLRIIFWMNPFLHALFGLSRIRFSRYALGTFLGYVPTLAVATWASGSIVEIVKAEPAWLLAFVGVIVLLVVVRRIVKGRRRTEAPS